MRVSQLAGRLEPPRSGMPTRGICGSILEAPAGDPEVLPNFLRKLRMPSEPLPEVPPATESKVDADASDTTDLPVELTEFSQRLASFGLGETPDPLLTEARPPAKRRPPG
jgi:hypothetical protein